MREVFLGDRFLEEDVDRADTNIGKQAKRLSSAKSAGAGIGGLLGAIALTVVTGGASAPLLALAGGAGALVGSKVGGATSGVSQSSLMGNKFRKESTADLATQIAGQEFSDVAQAAVSSYLQADFLNKAGKGLSAFGAGVKEHGLKDTMARTFGVGADAFADKTWLQGIKDNPELLADMGPKELARYETLTSAPEAASGGLFSMLGDAGKTALDYGKFAGGTMLGKFERGVPDKPQGLESGYTFDRPTNLGGGALDNIYEGESYDVNNPMNTYSQSGYDIESIVPFGKGNVNEEGLLSIPDWVNNPDIFNLLPTTTTPRINTGMNINSIFEEDEHEENKVGGFHWLDGYTQ